GSAGYCRQRTASFARSLRHPVNEPYQWASVQRVHPDRLGQCGTECPFRSETWSLHDRRTPHNQTDRQLGSCGPRTARTLVASLARACVNVAALSRKNYPMRKIFLLFMPPNNPEAMLHYQETIQRPVSLDRVAPFINQGVDSQLRRIFGARPAAVWGSEDTR